MTNTLRLASLLHRARVDDPYRLYETLRKRNQAHWDSADEMWVLTRYGAVVSALLDERLSSARLGVPNNQDSGAIRCSAPALMSVHARQVLFLDPPPHTRMRAALAQGFAQRTIRRLRPQAQRHASELLAAGSRVGHMDVVVEFARPLVALVLADLLGLPTEDHELVTRWSRDFAASYDRKRSSPEMVEQVLHSAEELLEYLGSLVARKRSQPGDDLVSVLVRGREAGVMVSTEDLVVNCAFLLFARLRNHG